MDWLINFIETVNKFGFINVLSCLIYILLFIILYFLYVWVRSGHALDFFQSQAVSKKKKADKARLDANKQLDTLLLQLRAESHSDLVGILEMHNGKDNPCGLPFLYLDLTYESTAHGVPSITKECTDMSLSHYPISNYLFENRFFIGKVEDLEDIDEKLKMKLEANDFKYVGIIMLNTKHEIGFLELLYKSAPKITKNKIHANLGDFAQKISPILDYTKD